MARQSSDPVAGFLEVDGEQFAVADHHPAVDDHSANVCGASAVDRKPSAVHGLEMRLGQVDEDQVGDRACGQDAVTGAESERLCAG